MGEAVEQIKAAVQEILGDSASSIFLSRVDKTLDEGGKDKASLTLACEKVQKMVNLFIGVSQAKVIEARCREILGKMP